MAESIYEIPPDLPVDDLRGELWSWWSMITTGSTSQVEDSTAFLQSLAVALEDLPEFIENASPEQLQKLYAYKAAVENTENWNDLSNEEKNAILEEAGLGSPFGDGAEYAEGDQVAWEDMTEEQRNAHAVRRYERTGETNPWYDQMTQEEIDAAYEYLKTDGDPAIYGTQDGYDYVWENNKDYIIQQCESVAGCNADMQAWYDRWEYSGKPTDKSGMVDPEDPDYLEWLNSQGDDGGDDTGPEPTKTLGDLLDELAAEEEVDRDVLDGIVDIIETVKGSIPTDPESAIQTVKDILGSTILGSALEECESWTGTTTTDNGTVVPSWTKCVDVGIFGIPGLDLPLPPGMIDISTSVYDIIEKAEDIGQSFEDFINDPTGWLEDLVDKAIEKVQDIWGDITGAIDPKSTGGLLDILNDWLGNVLGGYILSQVKEKTEVLNPFLYAQDCSEEGFVEPYEGYCEEAGAVNCESQFNKSGGTVLNAAECGECLQEGFKDFGNGCEPVCQYDDSIPASSEECKEPWSNPEDAPTAEECAAANKTFIPANVQNQEASKCGGCLEGYQPEGNECVEVLDPCPGNQVRNELTDECEDPPPEFVVGDPCKTVEGDNGTYDADGNCIPDPTFECWDGSLVAKEEDCPEDTRVECWDGSLAATEAECPEDTRVECWDGSLATSLAACPEDTRVDCWDGAKANSLEECSEDTRVECWDGSKALTEAECPEDTRVDCWDGSKALTEAECPEDTRVECWDGAKANSLEECSEDTRVECWDGSLATSLAACPEDTRPKEGDPCDSNGDGNLDGTYQASASGELECVAGGTTTTLCEDGSTPDPNKGCREDWCDDAMTIPKDAQGNCPEGPIEECVKPDGTPTGATVESGCEECPQGQAFNENGVCAKVTTETCSNGATNYPLCTECADGSTTDPNKPCGGDPECNDCTCAEYAAQNPQECGTTPLDCDDPAYAAANPDICGTTPNPCDDAVYASENPLECGWVECPDGSFAPTKEQCPGGCPEGQEPCEALGGECTTPENCPGGDDGGGGGGGGAGMFTGAKPVEIGFDIAGDPQLLARQEFPITDYLAGLFKGIV